MSKIELGIIVTIILAIIGGAKYIGNLEGRVKGIENDNYFTEKKRNIKEDIKNNEEQVLSNIKKESEKLKKIVENIKQENQLLLTALESKINIEINSLKINPSRNVLGYTSSRGGGANAMTMSSSCPAGEVMVGIEMIIGGTCHNQCDRDGGAFHKYRIICSPRFN